MPIKSKAQRRKFAELLLQGKISPEVYEEWNRGAGGKELPERLHPKVEPKRKRKTAATRKAAPKRKPAARKKAAPKRKPAAKRPGKKRVRS